MTTTTADADFWNDLADRYAAQPIDDVPAYERKLAITKARLTREQRILEVGCGTGSLAIELSPHVREVHAVDISCEMLRIAREKAARAEIENVTFHERGLHEALPFEAGSFDGAMAWSILHLVENRREVLRELYDALRPGGFLVSSTVCLGESWVPYGAILPVMRWLGKAPRVWILDQAKLLAEMKEVGFEQVTVHDVGAKPVVAFVVASKPAR